MKATHGTHKLFVELGDKSILAHTLEAASSIPFEERVVVTGSQREDVERVARSFPVRCVFNEGYASGMAGSIRAGVNALTAGADGVMIVLADMPFVQAATYTQLLDSLVEHPDCIAVPIMHGKRGNPVLFPMAYKQELTNLTGDAGAKPILARFAASVREVAVDDVGIFADLDTHEDLQRLASSGLYQADVPSFRSSNLTKFDI
jgi:molybdenum cofactor cytidylyltransferase